MLRSFGIGETTMTGKPGMLLKFKADMPISQRTALVDFGFQYYAAKHGDFVIFSKPDHVMAQQKIMKAYESDAPWEDDKPEPAVFGTPPEQREVLGPPWEADLEARMTKIVDAYLDPYSHLGAIKAQIIHMSRTLPNKEQEKWCMDWIEKNLDEEFFTPQWENPDYVPEFGNC